MAKFRRLVTGGLLVLVSTACGVEADHPESADAEEGEATDTEPLVMATQDFNKDGLVDLAVKTRNGSVYLDTMLLNQGGQVFQWLDGKSARDEVLMPDSDAWVDHGVYEITELERNVAGLSETLGKLPRPSMVDLGLESIAGTARNWLGCPSHWFCMFQHDGYRGMFYGSALNGCTVGVRYVGWFNDLASSWTNASGCRIAMFEHANYYGASDLLMPMTSVAWPGGTWWNDRISSWVSY